MTPEERHLWYDFLRVYPIRFRRQKIIGEYIVDFYCAQACLVIEVDGIQHKKKENAQKDRERTAFLETQGLTVLRIPNAAMNRDFDGVCSYIDKIVKRKMR